jgi:calcium/calmodulin-dependent 3',5'-cyclic nucleotide phosphodiesterase
LKEIHRDVEEDPNKQEEDDEKIKSILNIQQRKWNRLVKMLDTFEEWNFDIFKYYEILNEQTLPHFAFRVFHKYCLLEKFTIPESNFLELWNKIHKSFYDKSVYHCPMHTVQTTHNFYYLVRKGEIMKRISDLVLMAGLIASLLHDVGHPGVTNSFLISTKHLKAIRYNDRSVLENHHLAMGFKILLDPQNDILESLSEAQTWDFRQIIINMVLSTDITNHFEQLNAIRVTKNFPEDNKKDRQALMNILLYASDHAISCKPTLYYFKWMAEQMEEFYQQGDIERKLGLTITPFFDRTTSNPFVFQRGYLEVIVRPIFLSITGMIYF